MPKFPCACHHVHVHVQATRGNTSAVQAARAADALCGGAPLLNPQQQHTHRSAAPPRLRMPASSCACARTAGHAYLSSSARQNNGTLCICLPPRVHAHGEDGNARWSTDAHPRRCPHSRHHRRRDHPPKICCSTPGPAQRGATTPCAELPPPAASPPLPVLAAGRKRHDARHPRCASGQGSCAAGCNRGRGAAGSRLAGESPVLALG